MTTKLSTPATHFPQSSLANITPWQQTVAPEHQISGYHRAGENTNLRFHFLHGTGFCAMSLAKVASLLPEQANIWLTDVPGHGNSTQPNHNMPHWQKMAYNVADAIEKQANVYDDGKLIGVGHSKGGILTLLAAAKYPNLFSQVILLDPVLFSSEIIIAQKLMRATGAWRHSSLAKAVSRRRSQWANEQAMFDSIKDKALYRNWQQEVLWDYIHFGTKPAINANSKEERAIALCCNPSWEASIFGSYPKGLWHAVRNVKVPVTILVAENSYGFITKSAKRASKINPMINWQVFGKNHCFPMEQPQETAKIIQSLI